MTWSDQLQQASFRGVPFAVLGGEGRFGRRVTVHEYPGRDKPYIEDMGRSGRRINLVGFLVEDSLVYGGGAVIDQRNRMIAAAEFSGPGTLVHPTLGELNVSIPDGGLITIERWDVGRYFELNFAFIESGARVFPSATTDTTGSVFDASASLDAASSGDFVGAMEGVIKYGHAIIGMVINVVAGYAELAGRVSRDATNLMHMTSLLTGNYGRYTNGAVSSAFVASQKATTKSLTIADLVTQGANERVAISEAASALTVAGNNFDSSSMSTFVTAAQALAVALFDSIADPRDAIRLLGSLASYSPNNFTSGSTIGNGQASAQDATGAVLRRAALSQLAKAAAQYAPSSYDDAAQLRATVTGYIDAEMLIAGDAGDDSTYTALRTLRQTIVADITARGSSLARLRTVAAPSTLPSLVLAQRLYQDPSRADELVGQADPIHPAFMPPSFRALAS